MPASGPIRLVLIAFIDSSLNSGLRWFSSSMAIDRPKIKVERWGVVLNSTR